MRGSKEKSMPDVLDSAQLVRIEAVHRGFLYQHLYAVGCLLLAQKASVETVTVELDEDIELNSRQERIYVQVKTRLKPIILSDVSARSRGLRSCVTSTLMGAAREALLSLSSPTRRQVHICRR